MTENGNVLVLCVTTVVSLSSLVIIVTVVFLRCQDELQSVWLCVCLSLPPRGKSSCCELLRGKRLPLSSEQFSHTLACPATRWMGRTHLLPPHCPPWPCRGCLGRASPPISVTCPSPALLPGLPFPPFGTLALHTRTLCLSPSPTSPLCRCPLHLSWSLCCLR